MLREKGFDIIDYGVIKDNPETLKECLLRASQECDAVITSGGVSVGEADFTRKVVLEIGELISWHCLIKPGKPLAVGKIGKAYFFGLPEIPLLHKSLSMPLSPLPWHYSPVRRILNWSMP